MMRGLMFFVVLFAVHLAVFAGWAYAVWRVVEHGHYIIGATAVLVVWADAPRMARVVQQFVRGEK